jgi:hypothetical protein
MRRRDDDAFFMAEVRAVLDYETATVSNFQNAIGHSRPLSVILTRPWRCSADPAVRPAKKCFTIVWVDARKCELSRVLRWKTHVLDGAGEIAKKRKCGLLNQSHTRSMSC